MIVYAVSDHGFVLDYIMLLNAGKEERRRAAEWHASRIPE